MGIGYGAEIATCAERGVGTLASASDITDCLLAQHECRVENLLSSEVPRARELLELAGRDPRVEFPCLAASPGASGGDVDATKAKLAVKCQKAIGTAGAKFAALKAKLTQRCLGAVYACVQVKPVPGTGGGCGCACPPCVAGQSCPPCACDCCGPKPGASTVPMPVPA